MQLGGEVRMKKVALIASAAICFFILITAVINSVCASISIKGTVDDSVYIVYDFKNIDPIIYSEIKASPQGFNISTIPEIIKKNLAKQNLILVRWGLGSQTNIYDDAARAIQISFYLAGTDIINFTINATTMRRTYQVNTEWRKFQLDLTSTLSVNFTQILLKPIAEWQKLNETSFIFQNEENGFFDISFELILPKTATQVQAIGDIIIYDTPARFEELIINSPFIILLGLIIITIIVVIYRKIK
jgi:hypothetical protein